MSCKTLIDQSVGIQTCNPSPAGSITERRAPCDPFPVGQSAIGRPRGGLASTRTPAVPARRRKCPLSREIRLQADSRGGGTRTPDLRFWRPPLYQLSYAPVPVGQCTERVSGPLVAPPVPSARAAARARVAVRRSRGRAGGRCRVRLGGRRRRPQARGRPRRRRRRRVARHAVGERFPPPQALRH
jgi:hypothetical protein